MVGSTITKEGEVLPSEIGTPQGSIMSPVLANIYLNEVIDQWYMENYGSYNNIIVRYADDAVFFFKKEDDCKKFQVALKARVENYGLKLNEEKTKMLNMDKSEQGRLDFLGISFYWGKQARRRILKVKTQKEKLIKGIQEFYNWIKTNRNREKLKDLSERRMLRVAVGGLNKMLK